jgi:hypothetical protein
MFENVGVFIREKVWLQNSLSLLAQTQAEYKIKMSGNYPEKKHSDHGEDLKSRIR